MGVRECGWEANSTWARNYSYNIAGKGLTILFLDRVYISYFLTNIVRKPVP